ncbi:hypothetical protein BN1200_880001 [Klebsiella variicola]|nr:hypothetical protein BN1200_880001 [Klebsiella variicola]
MRNCELCTLMLIYMIFYVNLMLINESLMGEDKIKC